MHTQNNLSLINETLEELVISLENLSKNVEKEDNLEALFSYAKEFYEKLYLITKEITHKNIQFSIIKKEVSGRIELDKGKPILENFIPENYKSKCL